MLFYFIIVNFNILFISFIFISCFHSCCITISTLHGASVTKTISPRGPISIRIPILIVNTPTCEELVR